jgi:hypothetical protein
MEIADEHVRRTFLPDIPNPKLTGQAEPWVRDRDVTSCTTANRAANKEPRLLETS